MNTPRDERKYPGFERRVMFIGLAFLLTYCILVARLWELQIVRGYEFQGKADSNRLREQRLEAPRGLIYGRGPGGEDIVLADNRAARDLYFVPADILFQPANEDTDFATVCERLERIVGIDGAEFLERIEKTVEAGKPHEQILIKKDVPHGVAARIEEYGYALPGVITIVRPIRRYIYGQTGGMILGYLGEVNEREMNAKPGEYRMGDLRGRAGLELVYEDRLRGDEGEMLLTQFAVGKPQLRTDPYGQPYVKDLVDNYGHALHVESAINEPRHGEPLHITLDIGLQAKCESLLAGEEGAIAVLNAETGEVYALASSPGFDPSVFVNRNTSELRQEILTAKPNRMINRAFQDVYAPGSTFKILMAAAALEEGVIDKNTTFYCPGKFRLTPNGHTFHCWWRRGHGDIAVVDAIATSCDVFFYNVGLGLGVDRMTEWSNRIGYGRPTGLDLPGEVSGVLPGKEWKADHMRGLGYTQPWDLRWYDGDTVNFSIGQGYMSATPLQTAVLMAAVLNGGHRVTPYLMRDAPARVSDQLFSPEVMRIVIEGMQRCVEKTSPVPTGTGKAARIEGMTVLGKTGSAQVASLKHVEIYENEEDIPRDLRDHAWFMAGVLDREPQIAMCILVEHGHHGSSEAAPLAKEVIEYFYANCVPTEPEPGKRLAKAEGDD